MLGGDKGNPYITYLKVIPPFELVGAFEAFSDHFMAKSNRHDKSGFSTIQLSNRSQMHVVIVRMGYENNVDIRNVFNRYTRSANSALESHSSCPYGICNNI
ncbi:hypothetical protein D3C73_1472480 [compost metagenome]